jgi:cell division protein FtsI/penicillin-binding protein 2
MQGTTLAIVVVLAIVVFIALILISARRGRMRRLPAESQQRYAANWQAIRTRFIDDPHGAVTEADQMVVALLQEQGLKVDQGKRAPDDLTKARRAARLDRGAGATEDLRTSMLHYQRIVDHGVGESTRKAAETGRREVAS